MTDAQKAARLRMALGALENASAWVEQALGGTDVGTETQDLIQNIIEDLVYDVMELEGAL